MVDFPGRGTRPTVSPGTGRSITWLLELRAAQRRDHPFLVWEPMSGPREVWTYAAFAEQVRRVAAGLSGRGLGQGDRMVIHLENSPEFLFIWFACARIGVVAVCTNTRSSREEMAYFGEHSEAVAAVTEPTFAGLIDDAMPQLKWVAVTSRDAMGDPGGGAGSDDGFASLVDDRRSVDPAPASSSAPAWIQYTSGTTSRPKAVVLTHANALWTAKMSATHEGLGAGDVHFVHLPLFHINALGYSTLATLWAGGTMVLVPRFSASRFWDVSVRNSCTWASVIPFCVVALSTLEVPAQHSYRLWGNGYSAVPEDELFRIKTIGWYGMTETVTHVIVDDPLNPGVPFSMGRAAAGYELAIVREDGTAVELDETGSLFVRGIPGVSLFAGYLHDEQATRDTVSEDGWLRTGDLVAPHADGSITFSDRTKDMLKVGGENVAASEIERVVIEVPGVSEVAVVSAPHPMLDEVPIAFVISTDGRPGLADEVLAACRTRLSDFKVPREVRVVPEMPRSTLNKISKAELRRQLAAERAAAAAAE